MHSILYFVLSFSGAVLAFTRASTSFALGLFEGQKHSDGSSFEVNHFEEMMSTCGLPSLSKWPSNFATTYLPFPKQQNYMGGIWGPYGRIWAPYGRPIWFPYGK